MDNQELKRLNALINQAYECATFADFLKLAILNLHGLIAYDSGIFFCAISEDSSYFKPYVGGKLENHLEKQPFEEKEAFMQMAEDGKADPLPLVYTAQEYYEGKTGAPVEAFDEPRRRFLLEDHGAHTACMRILYKGRFLGEIYLHRQRCAPPFSQQDLFCLRLLQPHISTVMSGIHSRLAALQTESAGQAKCGLCMMDEHASITGANACALQMLKSTTLLGASLLYHVKEMCTALAREGGPGRCAAFKTEQDEIKVDVFRVGDGNKYIVEMVSLNDTPSPADYKYKFSKREAEIIDALIQGKNNRQIAQCVNLSCNTIKTHVKNIYKKAGVGNRTELAFLLMGGLAGSEV
jgi:DNA-binding CsgD family transcriptional regulator